MEQYVIDQVIRLDKERQRLRTLINKASNSHIYLVVELDGKNMTSEVDNFDQIAKIIEGDLRSKLQAVEDEIEAL